MRKFLVYLFSFLFIFSATFTGGMLLIDDNTSKSTEEGFQETLNDEVSSTMIEPVTNSENWIDYYSDDVMGAGTEGSPYLISNARQLAWISYMVHEGDNLSDTYFEQTCDIDLSLYWWTPIGSDSSWGNFGGHYNGDGHTVSGIYISDELTDSPELGLFGSIENGAVSNLNVENLFYKLEYGTPRQYIGGIVGYVRDSEIYNCSNQGDILVEADYVGGIVGYAENTSIYSCFNSGNITSYSGNAGGIVGSSQEGLLGSCYNIGSILACELAGGIAADFSGMHADPGIYNCYNVGTIVSTNSMSAGIVAVSTDQILDSFNVGAVYMYGDYGYAICATYGSDSCYYGWNAINSNIYDGSEISDDEIMKNASYEGYTSEREEPWGDSYIFTGNSLPYLTNIKEEYQEIIWTYADNEEYWIDYAVEPSGSGGDGDPYLISTPEELAWIAQEVNYNGNNFIDEYFVQTADIDLSGMLWIPIGDDGQYWGNHFEGNYDGGFYTISNLTTPYSYHAYYSEYSGLFGCINYMGGAGYLTIQNVILEKSIIQGMSAVGGIVGSSRNDFGAENTIYNCSFSGHILLDYQGFAGGIVGQASYTTIENCYNLGNINTTYEESYTGGIVGGCDNFSNIHNSYNAGFITSCNLNMTSGGIIGEGADTFVENSFNINAIEGVCAPIVGESSSIDENNCYYFSIQGEYNNVDNPYVFYDDYFYGSELGWSLGDIWTLGGSNNLPTFFNPHTTLTIHYDGLAENGFPLRYSFYSIDEGTGTFTEEYSDVELTAGYNPRILNSKYMAIAFFVEDEQCLFDVKEYDFEISSDEYAYRYYTYVWDTSKSADVYIKLTGYNSIIYYSNDENNEIIEVLKLLDESINILGSSAFPRNNYELTHWATNSSGTGTIYNFNTTYSNNRDLTLYAQWEAEVYTIYLNNGSISSETRIYEKYGEGFYSNSAATNPINRIPNIPEGQGYVFNGYYTSSNGRGIQVIDAQGNILINNTYVTYNRTFYAYLTFGVAANYDSNGEYWYIDLGKMPQSRVTDTAIISALNGDSTETDSDGVTTSDNVYYFAELMLSAKIYNENEYCNYRGNWYLVEPIRWRLADNSNFTTGYSTTIDTMIITNSVVYLGKYSSQSIDIGDGYISANESFSSANFFLNNISFSDLEYIVEYSANSENFISTGISTETSTNTIFLSSTQEINQVFGNYESGFSDLVKDYLQISGQSQFYYTRNLGGNINNITCYTNGGAEIFQKPTYMLGMKFSIMVTGFTCV